MNLYDLRKSLDDTAFDLCLVDVTEQQEQVCKLIESLRNGFVGRNPFMVVMATSWAQSGELVRRVIDSGADDLVLRPVSTGVLRSRIVLQIDSRKDFVVTSTYIGPDRRRDSARGNDIPLLSVPNTLRAKAAQGVLGGNAPEIETARKQMDRQRLQQCALRIGIGTRLIEDHLATPEPGSALEEELVQLAASAEEIQRRTGNPDFAHLAVLCEATFGAIVDIRHGLSGPKPASGEAMTKPLSQLTELCLAVHTVASPERDAEDIRSEIDRTVAKIHARPPAKAPLARAAKG